MNDSSVDVTYAGMLELSSTLLFTVAWLGSVNTETSNGSVYHERPDRPHREGCSSA